SAANRSLAVPEWIPGKANTRSEIVPVLFVKGTANRVARKAQCGVCQQSLGRVVVDRHGLHDQPVDLIHWKKVIPSQSQIQSEISSHLNIIRDIRRVIVETQIENSRRPRDES